MKKLLTISLAVFYLFIASGVYVNMHYCGGKLKKIAFYSVNDEDGCCGSEEKSDGCCKDKSSFIKVKDDHHSFGAVKVASNFLKYSEVIQPELKISLSPEFTNQRNTDHDPPVYYDNPLYLKLKVLLI